MSTTAEPKKELPAQSAKRWNSRKLWCSVFWLFLAVQILFLICHGYFFASRNLDSLSGALTLGSCVFLACLTGAYGGLGKSKIRFIAMFLLGPLIGYGTPWFLSSEFTEVSEFILFMCSIVVIVASTTGLLRFFNGHLIPVADATPENDALRFGIRDVLIWTGVLALLFAGGRAVLSIERLQSLSLVALITSLAACIALCCVIYIWALLGARVTIIKVIAIVASLIASSLVIDAIQDRDFAIISAGGQIIGIIATMLVRLQSYRFVKK